MATQLSTNKIPLLTKSRISLRQWAPYLIVGLIGLCAVFFLLFRLDTWPRPWFDEGSYLKVAKNYAGNGVYADYSSEGNIYTGAIVAVGPTTILPVALIFKLVGTNILYARLMTVGYSIATLGALWWLCAELWNSRVSVIAVVCLLMAPLFVEYGRQVLGEVPGLFFLLLGLALWVKADRHSALRLIGAGVAFGLAGITKYQYAVIILPALFIALVLEIVWYRQHRWLYLIVPGVIAGAIFATWTFYVFYGLDAASRDIAAEQALLRSTTATAFFIIQPMRNIDNFLAISTNGFGVLLIPTLLYLFLQKIRHPRSWQPQDLGAIMLCLAVGMYIFSNGWIRYTFPVWGLLIPSLADMLARIVRQVLGVLAHWRGSLGSEELPAAFLTGMLAIGLLASGLIPPARSLLHDIANNYTRDVYHLAEYLNATAKPDALIETWEQEVTVLTDHTYHLPPTSVMVARNANRESASNYDFRSYGNPDLVIVGPFSRNKAIYTPERLLSYDLVETIGVYSVYRKRAN